MKKVIAGIIVLIGLQLQAAPADTLTLAKMRSMLTLPVEGESMVECSVRAEWPIGCSPELSSNLQRWCLGVIRQSVGETPAQTERVPLFSELQSRYLENAQAEAVQGRADKKDERFLLALEFELRKVFESKQVVTFVIEAPRYGVNGLSAQTKNYASFIKENGNKLTWEEMIQPKYDGRFHRLAASNLQSFFGVRDFPNMMVKTIIPTETTEQKFPLPQQGPAIVENGIELNYEPGEIAQPEMGRPQGTVNYKSFKSWLTKSAKNYWRK